MKRIRAILNSGPATQVAPVIPDAIPS